MPRSSSNLKHTTSSTPTVINPETTRGLLVLFLLVCTLIIGLSFFAKAGVWGEWIRNALFISVGWVAYAVPFLLITVGYILLQPSFVFGAPQVIGLLLLIFGITGLLHISVETTDSWSVVSSGMGGGYIGFISSTPLISILGVLGAVVFLVALVIGGILLLFETTLQKLFGRFVKIWLWLIRGTVKSDTEDRVKNSIPATESLSRVQETLITKPLEKLFKPRQVNNGINTLPLPGLESKQRLPSPRVQVPLDLLEDRVGEPTSGDIKSNMDKIQKTLQNFGIEVEMGGVNIGPTVTQYTLAPAQGVKLSHITTLSNDLALALAAHPIRIEAPIPGQSLVGIEVPNQAVATVGLKEILASEEFKRRQSNLAVAIGKDVAGRPWVADIARMPHLLIAGATGSGKSVCINGLIVSLLYSNSPEEVKFIIIDPKRVELASYNNIPHLLTPVITEVDKTINALKWVVGEMDRRYIALSQSGKRNIASYNHESAEKMPYLVVVIDELADLMAVAANEVEQAIIRLAQMARAVGIHLVIATQRPSVDVITGLIKANITSRIAFAVASATDSRTILDTGGAEKLLGRGDCLFVSADLSKPKRLQAAFIGDTEIERVVGFWKSHGTPEFHPEVLTRSSGSANGSTGEFSSDEDELLAEAKSEVIRAGKASASLLQRRLRVGYARAARLLDMLEERGIIGPADGAKPRDVLISADQPEYSDLDTIEANETELSELANSDSEDHFDNKA